MTMTETSASDLCEMWSSEVYSRTQDEKTATGSPQHNASYNVEQYRSVIRYCAEIEIPAITGLNTPCYNGWTKDADGF